MLYNTLGLASACSRYLSITSLPQLQELISEGALIKQPLFILGGGSNVVLPAYYEGTILHLDTKGIYSHDDTDDASRIFVTAQAGENWNDFVLFCSGKGWYGLENLVAIPGSVGASPVQNVGAYGVEAKDVISSVKACDISTGQERVFTNAECQFGYRSSVFKTTLSGKYVVTEVTFHLSRYFEPNLSYKALAEAVRHETASGKTENSLCGAQMDAHNLTDIISRLRWSKLPRPEELGSCGSFFKNPIVTKAHLDQLLHRYPDMPFFPAGSNSFKIPAAYLIDHAGWKGRRLGSVGVYEKQALVLVNYGGATAEDVRRLADAIIADVASLYTVTLTPEAIFV